MDLKYISLVTKLKDEKYLSVCVVLNPVMAEVAAAVRILSRVTFLRATSPHEEKSCL